MASAAPTSVIPAQFGVPPYSDEFEAPENNTGLTTVLNKSSTVPISGVVAFKQTDVIYAWLHEMAFTYTLTASTDVINVSPYYPYTFCGLYRLNMQQQYPAIDVNSLIDLAVVGRTRALSNSQQGLMQWYVPGTLGTAPANGATAAASGNPFLWPWTTQTPQVDLEPAYASGVATALQIPIYAPACAYFDAYWELTYDGLPLSGPHNGYVSPQDMAGYARVVTPDMTFNALFIAATALPGSLDTALFGGNPGTAATLPNPTLTHRFQRIGVLGNTDPEVLPGPTNWQYNIAHQRTSLVGRQSIDIPLNGVFLGQIMGIFVRLFDQSSASPATLGGNPIPLNFATETNIYLQYGGNSVRIQGRPQDFQRRFLDQHRFMPPAGYLIIDLATDRQGWTSNAYLLNTLREAGVTLHIDFASSQSATAYAEVIVDGLRWIPLTPVSGRR